ncbi:cysteine proteinase [Lindgomyces ingoldianus]|uniref:Cysteine proteinase n=1 Tax=Lindgomyces ingoldianus TaxID=673940 RepID=A0ACB6R556_9PLEO|nr:cysteine proteinase [Lindgomyces ingoldianus]KAF2474389.1 cysteine proteinase [Lindgomyces ingoldianus]
MPTATATFNWNNVFKSTNCGPVPRPGTSGNTSCDNFSGPLPKVVDWRNRWGVNWLATIQAMLLQDQKACGSCWSFAATALMETIARIQHGIWNKRSEAELLEGTGRTCASGYKAFAGLEWIKGEGNGLVDYTCDTYVDADRPYMACSDRSGRALKIQDYYELTDINDQKRWLWQVGPLAAGIDCYSDFGSWTPSKGVYKHTPISNESHGGHAMLVVGYDDYRQCWIVRNSWGSDYGDHGYVYIGYGEVAIDSWYRPKHGVTNLSPDPHARGRHSNGNIVQSGDGTTHRDFEVLRRKVGGNMVRLVRSGEGSLAWSVKETINVLDPELRKQYPIGYGPNNPVKGQPMLLETTFGRQKEALYWEGYDNSFTHWYYSKSENRWWNTPATDDLFYPVNGGEIRGYPGFIQNDNSDFTVVAHVYVPWIGNSVAQADIKQSGPSLVQSNIGYDLYDPTTSGNLYVVAVKNDGSLQMFWRKAKDEEWKKGERFAIGYNIGDTPPVMIQDFWTKDENAFGGFQLLVAHNGHVDHWQRVNDDILKTPPVDGSQGKWQQMATFGSNIRHVWGLVQGSFNHALEAIVEDNNGDLWHWQYTGTWKQVAKLPSA